MLPQFSWRAADCSWRCGASGLCGAAWGQRQPGNTAVFWPPQLVPGEAQEVGHQLASAVVAELDRAEIAMTQVLLPPGDADHVNVISAAGFRHLADLLYLSWEVGQPAAQSAKKSELAFPSVRSIATGEAQCAC